MSKLILDSKQALLNAINTGLIVLDGNLNIIYWNRWMAKVSGVTTEYACQKTFLEIYPELENSRIHSAIQTNFELGMPAVISNILNKSPLPLYFSASKDSETRIPMLQHIQITQITSAEAEAKSLCLIHISDVTASVMREKLLEKHIDERKVAEEAMREARRLAEMASNAKSQFLANISHEVRTPLNGILGIVELLKDCQLDEEASSYIKPLNESSVSLLKIINDVLDYSKIDSNKLSLNKEEFNFKELIDDLDKIISVKLTSKKLTFKVSLPDNIPQFVIGDKGRLKQVLISLLDNAVKFTDAGLVSLNILVMDKTRSDITLSINVKDTGIGISQDEQLRIFEFFSQGDNSSTRKYNGTGLGLAICKQLVVLMGGTLRVQSKVGQGAIFSFKVSLGVK